ncbi:MAG: hypothetical protein BWY95_01105 [Bacteroidetes bacterium ADurb.BinA104]|nr:MAG: hypothetical protein BWY95_01105 [Bacteroidetes bacterium ADurb.BinA104]
MIFFAYVYKEAGITFLRLVAFFFLAPCIVALLACYLLEFGCILIVAHKPSKLAGHYAFDDIVLIHPVQTAEDIGQEALYLFLVYLNALQVIYDFVKLFLTNLAAGRHVALYESLIYGLLNKPYFAFFAHIDNRY